MLFFLLPAAAVGTLRVDFDFSNDIHPHFLFPVDCSVVWRVYQYHSILSLKREDQSFCRGLLLFCKAGESPWNGAFAKLLWWICKKMMRVFNCFWQTLAKGSDKICLFLRKIFLEAVSCEGTILPVCERCPIFGGGGSGLFPKPIGEKTFVKPLDRRETACYNIKAVLSGEKNIAEWSSW